MIDTNELIIGDDWLIAHYPRMECVYIGPNMDDRSFDAYLNQFVVDIGRRASNQTIGTLYHVPDATLNLSRRRRLANLLDEHKQTLAQTTAAYAMATRSPVARGVITTLFWLAPPAYPYKVVTTPEQGLEFIFGYLPAIDPVEIAAAFGQLVSQAMRQAG